MAESVADFSEHNVDEQQQLKRYESDPNKRKNRQETKLPLRNRDRKKQLENDACRELKRRRPPKPLNMLTPTRHDKSGGSETDQQASQRGEMHA